VLVTAAAGGLGLVAVQIAKAIGAQVVATAGSDEKLASQGDLVLTNVSTTATVKTGGKKS
jgi:NADPH-dependent curcumin reductase CurA